MRSSNPYHREKIAGPSVLHTDPAVSKQMEHSEDVVHAEIEHRLIDKYLKEIERSKFIQEMRQPNQLSQNSGGTIVINNSTIGVLNPGQLVGNVKSAINQIADTPEQNEIKTALSKIALFLEENANANKVASEKYAEALELVSELAKQASTSKENRSLPSIIRSMAKSLGEVVQTVASGSALWQMYGPTIMAYFGL
jgi:hypothetical protein